MAFFCFVKHNDISGYDNNYHQAFRKIMAQIKLDVAHCVKFILYMTEIFNEDNDELLPFTDNERKALCCQCHEQTCKMLMVDDGRRKWFDSIVLLVLLLLTSSPDKVVMMKYVPKVVEPTLF